MSENMPDLMVTKQSLLYQQVCTTLAPEYISPGTESRPVSSVDELGDTPLFTPDFVAKFNALLVANGAHISGTTHGWSLMENCPACPCEESGRFHYMCSC